MNTSSAASPAAFRLGLLATLALVLALCVPLSGCLTCTPTLDVHRCRDATGRCDLAGENATAWDPSLDPLFPGIDHFVSTLEVGEHGHRGWSEERAEAFWTFYHVPLDAKDKQVFLTSSDGGLFTVRVLAC